MFNILDFIMIKENFEVKQNFSNDGDYEVVMNSGISVPNDNSKKEVFVDYSGNIKKNGEIVVSISFRYVVSINTDEKFDSDEEKSKKFLLYLRPYLEMRLSDDVNNILSKIRYPTLPMTSFSESNH